jgi:cob(I)alamin adenosyltransferase
MQLGQFQIYTGNGKGKTTAAVGLAVRAAGNGFAVYFGQFIKDMAYGEVGIMRSLPGITVEMYGTGEGCLIGRTPHPEDLKAAKQGLDNISAALTSGKYDVVVADEINVACALGLLSQDDLLALADKRPKTAELVFTGRGAPESCISKADLVTEMKEIHHYYSEKGLEARVGIER